MAALDSSALLTFAVTAAAIGILICRLAKMSAYTLRAVRYQHASLCGCLFFSLVVPADWQGATTGLGIVVYFMFSTHRWRVTAPGATTGPMPLDECPSPQGDRDANR